MEFKPDVVHRVDGGLADEVALSLVDEVHAAFEPAYVALVARDAGHQLSDVPTQPLGGLQQPAFDALVAFAVLPFRDEADARVQNDVQFTGSVVGKNVSSENFRQLSLDGPLPSSPSSLEAGQLKCDVFSRR